MILIYLIKKLIYEQGLLITIINDNRGDRSRGKPKAFKDFVYVNEDNEIEISLVGFDPFTPFTDPGSSLLDDCNVCDSDASNNNTPLTGTCDCAGTANGSAVKDNWDMAHSIIQNINTETAVPNIKK